MEESPAESCRRAIGASNQHPAQHDAEVAASESRSTASRGRAASQQGAGSYAACDAHDECDRDCRCPRGQLCDGRCNDKWSGDRFIHMVFGKRVCVSCKGVVLPQTVHELHKLVRQLQQQLEQREEEVLNGLPKKKGGSVAKLQAAEEHRVRSDSAKHAAEEKLQRVMQQVKQVQAQQQLAVTEAQAKEQEQAKRAAVAEKNARQLAAKVDGLQAEKLHHVEDMEVLEERLAALSAREEAAADLRLCKEQLAPAQSQLVTEGSQAQPHSQTQLPVLGGSGSSSFPKAFGCVEQRECLDELSVAVEQLAAVLTQGSNMDHPIVQQLLQAAKETAGASAAGVEVGYNLGISSWDSNAASAALHSHVLTLTLRTVQQLPWPPPSPFDTCLASCPESGRTDLQAAMQQLQQAKSSTLFLVAQQQAPSHPATREAGLQLASMQADVQQRLEQQLGLDMDAAAKSFLGHQMQAVAAAATRTQLLVSGLQCSCPGLQLVSSLEDWAAPEGQRACEAPVRQLLGKVQSSRPLFLVRPGLVCPAAGGGRQVLVRQQLVELVPDPAWLKQQCQEAAEELEAAKQHEADAAKKVYVAAQKKQNAEYTLLRHKEKDSKRHSASASAVARAAPA